MLRLNRMTDYAIVVLGALAHRHGDVLATAHLAELTGLAQPTVAKVSKILLAADLVETQRGGRGGYRVDGAQDPCAVSSCCFMSSHWNHVNLAIRNALNDVSLEDLTDPAQLFPLPVSPPITEDDSQLSRQ